MLSSRKISSRILAALCLITSVGPTLHAQPRNLDLHQQEIDAPFQVLARARRELQLTPEQVAACQHLKDYKRAEMEACYDAWLRVKDYPRTEIQEAMAEWVPRRQQTRRERLQLIRKRIQPDLRERFEQICLQQAVYHGRFQRVAERLRVSLSEQQAKQLRDSTNSKHGNAEADFELFKLLLLVEEDMVEKELGQRIDLGEPSRAALEWQGKSRGIPVSVLYQHHIVFEQLTRGEFLVELGVTAAQLHRLKAIGRQYDIRVRDSSMDTFYYSNGARDPYRMDGYGGYSGGGYGGYGSYASPPQGDPKVHMAKAKRAMAAMNAVLTKEQQARFRQIRYQAACGSQMQHERLRQFGIPAQEDRQRDVRLARVKQAVTADFRMCQARKTMGRVVDLAKLDRAMGPPSFEFLEFQVTGGLIKLTDKTRPVVARRGSAFRQLGKQAGDWYASAIE